MCGTEASIYLFKMAGSVKSQNQLSEEFTTEFNKKKGELTDQINSLTSKESSVAERLTTYSSEIQKLSKLLHDASMYLPSYSVKVSKLYSIFKK